MSTKMIYSKGHHAYKKSCQQLDKFIRQKERLLRDIKENNHNIYKWQCAVNALKEQGAKDIYGACTHAVFSGESLDKINKSALKKLFVSDTLPLTHSSPKIETVTISDIFAESIWRTNKNKSISSLFDVDKAL